MPSDEKGCGRQKIGHFKQGNPLKEPFDRGSTEWGAFVLRSGKLEPVRVNETHLGTTMKRGWRQEQAA